MNIKITILACLLCGAAATAFGQKDNDNKIPANGYWNIETNVNSPLLNTVKFYNEKNKLIGEKIVNGKKLDISKKRIQAQLNLMLEGVLLAQEHRKQRNTNTDLAAN